MRRKGFLIIVSCLAALPGVLMLAVGCSCAVSANAEPETTVAIESAMETTSVEETMKETMESASENIWQVVGTVGDYETRVTTNAMLLYAEPDDQSEVICEIPGGVEVIFKGEVLIKGESSPFICVEYDGKTGYTFWEIFADPILDETTEESTEEAGAEGETEETATEAGTTIEAASGTKYAIDSVNVRQQPTKDSEKLGSLSWSESVEVTGVTSDGKWYRIDIDGQEGFVSASYLSDTKPERPVVSQPSGGSGGSSASSGGSEDSTPAKAGESIPGLGVIEEGDGSGWDNFDFDSIATPDGWDDIVWE